LVEGGNWRRGYPIKAKNMYTINTMAKLIIPSPSFVLYELNRL
jgi:hypothetical protein